MNLNLKSYQLNLKNAKQHLQGWLSSSKINSINVSEKIKVQDAESPGKLHKHTVQKRVNSLRSSRKNQVGKRVENISSIEPIATSM